MEFLKKDQCIRDNVLFCRDAKRAAQFSTLLRAIYELAEIVSFLNIDEIGLHTKALLSAAQAACSRFRVLWMYWTEKLF